MQDLFGGILTGDEEETEGTEDVFSETGDKEKHKSNKNTPFFIIQFASISRAEEYCKALPYEKPIKSSLYKEDDRYFLLISKGKMGKKVFEELGFLSLEYGNLVGADAVFKSYMKEHMQCIIKKGAVKVLRNL